MTPDHAMDLVSEWGLVLIWAAIIISFVVGFLRAGFKDD